MNPRYRIDPLAPSFIVRDGQRFCSITPCGLIGSEVETDMALFRQRVVDALNETEPRLALRPLPKAEPADPAVPIDIAKLKLTMSQEHFLGKVWDWYGEGAGNTNRTGERLANLGLLTFRYLAGFSGFWGFTPAGLDAYRAWKKPTGIRRDISRYKADHGAI